MVADIFSDYTLVVAFQVILHLFGHVLKITIFVLISKTEFTLIWIAW